MRLRLLLLISLLILVPNFSNAQHSVARDWNEIMLKSIRKDFARPTVHARNLFHASIAMYDIWSIYTNNGSPYLIGKTHNGYTSTFNGIPAPFDLNADIEEAISIAMFKLLVHRFQTSPAISTMYPEYIDYMENNGYNYNTASVDYSTGSAAAFGNFVAQEIISYGLLDNSNEQNAYSNTSYTPVNPNLAIDLPGNPNLLDFSRWQPLSLDVFIDQSGNVIPFNTPPFLSPEWGSVFNFSLSDDDLTINNRNGFDYYVYHDPGTPPSIDLSGNTGITEYKWNFALVSAWSAHLDPSDSVMWDISPASIGNIQSYPTDYSGYLNFYNSIDGGDASIGHSQNPATGAAYTNQIVPRGDYTRVLAEFWADGPDSETPPGHWFTILNYVNDNPVFVKQFEGNGTALDSLEWDVKSYFTLGAAMHDAAVSAWGIKGWYDYIRPVSSIRGMCEFGQSSNPNLPNYDPNGSILYPGLIELVDSNDALVGSNYVNLNKVKVYAWKGPSYVNNQATNNAGVDWILAENWWPYQRPTFVTPPFAGYVSGHSTFSRAAAEVMTALTGDAFFPGGMGEFFAPANDFLVFENGPSVDVTLQWATYRDASDQCSLSRIWGGIHPPVDDIPGRLIGEKIGKRAFLVAKSYFENEYCVDLITKSGAITTNNFVKAASVLTADAQISNATNTTFEAGDTILLDSYFEIDASSNLIAEIKDCD